MVTPIQTVTIQLEPVGYFLHVESTSVRKVWPTTTEESMSLLPLADSK